MVVTITFPIVIIAVSIGLLCLVVGAYCLRWGLRRGLWAQPIWRAMGCIWLITVAVWGGALLWTLVLR